MAQPEPPALAGLGRSRALADLRRYFRATGLDNWEADARLLLLAACAIEPLALVRDPDVPLRAEEAARLEQFARRRAQREPATRILGRRPFWSVDLAVRPDVLDPRADTEALVRLALRSAPAPRRVLDLGCGSGAILCALLAEWSGAFGVGVDYSAAACAASRDNLAALGFGDRSAVVRASWGDALGQSFDLIVSNPPYIPSGDIAGLDAEVRDHDPQAALDGGADGLDAYRAICGQAARIMAPGAVLAVEFGLGQRRDVAAIALAGGLEEVDVGRDLAGRERAVAFVVGQRGRGNSATFNGN